MTSKEVSLEEFFDQTKDEEKVDDPLGDDAEVLPFKYAITSYGADYPVDGLVKRLKDGSIYVPSFQRGFVWKHEQASRFIESLLLGLPVPGIFLSKEQETQKLLVIDGQQRLRTLQHFYDGRLPDGSKFALTGVQKKFAGATYEGLGADDRRRLDDSIIHATVVKQDEPSADQSSIYHIFERLNTGGALLQPEEIRAAIFHGPFSELLESLNHNQAWRATYGAVNKRMRDQELILRFLALYFNAAEYATPMKSFLNTFMGRNRSLAKYSEQAIRKAFEPTIELAYKSLGRNAFKPWGRLNAAVVDALAVGLARRLEQGPVTDGEALKKAYTELIKNVDFVKAIETGTAKEESVKSRLDLATKAFASVK